MHTVVAAPLEELPLWVRAGAVVPVGPAVQHTRELATDGRLALWMVRPRTAPPGPMRTWLYEDDGESLAYREGDCARRAVWSRWVPARGAGALELEVEARQGRFMPARNHLDVVVDRAAQAPRSVRYEGAPVAAAEKPLRPLESEAGVVPAWWWDPASGRLTVRLPESPDSQRLFVEW